MIPLGPILAAMLIALHGDPLRDSLPMYEGELQVAGLLAPAEVRRDALAIPTIEGANMLDVVRAQGFVHAQERFFQMDLSRRFAAGELAELLGAEAVGRDRSMRIYRLREGARQVVERLDEPDRTLLEAYAAGVNACLRAMVAAPPEYSILGASPAEWLPEDCALVMFSMFKALQIEADIEERLAVMHETLPPPLYDFLTPDTSRFDAPMDMDGPGYQPIPVPGPDVFDLRAGGELLGRAFESDIDLTAPPPLVAGSNNWAVAGSRTAHGGAIVANDPHLMFSAPAIWYRCELRWPDHFAAGVSLPGVPLIIIGSNGHLAWGFTNTTADFQDLVIVEVDPTDPTRYRTPEGWAAFTEFVEEIKVRGGEPRRLTIRQTIWGPIDRTDFRGRPLALKWVALDPAMVNLNVTRMAEATTLEQGVQVMRSWHGPSQNVVLADDRGRIAWVVSGYLPKRVGFSGKHPMTWTDGAIGWHGPLAEQDRPVIVDPPSGLLFSANNRTTNVDVSRRLSTFWAGGERAKRIRDLLSSHDDLGEGDMLDIQLDTEVETLQWYGELALRTLVDEVAPEIVAAREAIDRWNGRADVDQCGLPILQEWRRMLIARVISPLVAECFRHDREFRYSWFLADEPLMRILEERPAHLLPQRFDSWDQLLGVSMRETLDDIVRRRAQDPSVLTWGQVNIASISHPAADIAPALLRPMLAMPKDPLPGHSDAVRVSTPTFGASMRMAVSPGREAEGILHMPTGQSGHPLSPHFRDGHAAWVRGSPTPFLAGATTKVLRLIPDRAPIESP